MNAMNMPGIGAPADPPVTAKLEFTGEGGESLRILAKGALLALPTAGFYRFWLITRFRRFLWQNTRLGQDHFDYLGSAKELLLGFLAAIAILVPVYVLYFLVALEVEGARNFASVPLALFFVVFSKFAIYRARRYRLTRTVFRGVRFTMGGSGIRYALMWVGWSLLSLVTLGLAYPWQVASLERYKMRNTRWGTLDARLDATGGSLFRQGIGLWLQGMALIVLVAGAIAYKTWKDWAAISAGLLEKGGFSAGGEHVQTMMMDLGLFGALITGTFLLLGLLYLLYVGVEWRWFLNGLRFGDLSVRTTLARRAWLVRTVILWGLSAAVLAVLGVVGAIVGYGLSPVFMAHPTVAAVAGGVSYLAMILGLTVVYRQVMVFGFWRAVVNSLEVENPQVLDHVAGGGQASGTIAEGFAEALDLGAF